MFSPSPLLSLPLFSCSCTVYTVCFLSALLCPPAANGLSGGALPPPPPLKHLLQPASGSLCNLRGPPHNPPTHPPTQNLSLPLTLRAHFVNVQRSDKKSCDLYVSVKILSRDVEALSRGNWTRSCDLEDASLLNYSSVQLLQLNQRPALPPPPPSCNCSVRAGLTRKTSSCGALSALQYPSSHCLHTLLTCRN